VKYLLDTHIWIWSVSKPEKLSEEVKNLLNDDSNELFISSISFWEFMVLSHLTTTWQNPKKFLFYLTIIEIRHS
jgi:PIN domain nuclease of toxin-antitoxin system